MKLSTKILATVLMVAGGSGAVFAYGKHGGWHMTHAEKAELVGDRVARKLELDASQRQNLDALTTLVAEIMEDAADRKQENFDQISMLLESPNFDQAKALELVQQKTSLVNEKAPQIIASLAVFLDSLDSEQKKQLQEFVEHRRDHRHHRH